MQRRQFLKAFSAAILSSTLPARRKEDKSTQIDSSLSVCDVHFHLLGLDPLTGCYMNPEFQQSMVYSLLSVFLGISTDEPAEKQDRQYIEKVTSLLNSPFKEHYAILLAMDGVYDHAGKMDLERTALHIPNDYLFKVCSTSDRFFPGASVNPYREDALDELDRVAERGAVLIKWIPGSQNIDPSDRYIIPFYRRLVELNLPLLTHAGSEHTIPVINKSYGAPELLERPLEEGVRVIVAHCAVDFLSDRRSGFFKFLEMLEKYPGLYGDISSLSLAHRTYRLRYLLDHANLFDRLYYGSDFPLQFFPVASPFYFLGRLSMDEAWEIQGIRNVLERDVVTLRAAGVPKNCFERGLDLIQRV